MLGNFQQALDDSEAGYQRYRPLDAAYHRENFVGHDPGICLIGHQAGALCLLGDTDAGYERVERTLAAMRATSHEPSRVVGAYCLGLMLIVMRDAPALQPIAAEALANCRRLGLTQYVGLFTVLTAWGDAATRQDPQAPGLALQGVETFGATGSRLRQPLLRAVAAEACLLCGQLDIGLQTADQALREVQAHGEFGWHAYALSVRAGLHRAMGQAHLAEQDGLAAMQVARAQEALGLELRAANQVAALWVEQGRTDKARGLLAPLLRRFTAQRETLDLLQARSLVGSGGPTPV
jgi:ATP/maltotriose-dependent transcriptional regulator MalT